MKNITVSVPDEVYRRARVRAAERDTSVSELVRDFLQRLDEGDAEFERRKQLQAKVLKSIETLPRRRIASGETNVHDRDAVR